jgi:hypothetical protein
MSVGMLALVSIPLACASEGGPDRELATAPDGSSEGSESDGGADAPLDSPTLDAGPCSDSNLCITAIPTDDKIHFTDLWGSGAKDVWAVGTRGTILHYDGATWEKADPVAPEGAAGFTLRSVWLGRPDDVWIADGYNIWHGTGWKGPHASAWSFVASSEEEPAPTVIRGHDQTVFIARSMRGENFFSIQGALSTSHGWTDGGLETTPIFAEYFLTFNAIAVSRQDEAWAIADLFDSEGFVFRISGASDPDPASPWQVEEYDFKSSTRQPLGVWGDDSAVWLVGTKGMLRRIARSAVPSKSFEIVESPVRTDLHDIFGFGPNDVWAVGEASTVLHWDGNTWAKLSTPFDHLNESEKPTLESIWGSSPTDIWIAGDGRMLHFDGALR